MTWDSFISADFQVTKTYLQLMVVKERLASPDQTPSPSTKLSSKLLSHAYRVTIYVVPNLLLTPKQRLFFSTWAPYLIKTFVLMSTGGCEQREWSPCTSSILRTREVEFWRGKDKRFLCPRLLALQATTRGKLLCLVICNHVADAQGWNWNTMQLSLHCLTEGILNKP